MGDFSGTQPFLDLMMASDARDRPPPSEFSETDKIDLIWSIYEKYEKIKISETKSGSMKNENDFI